MAEFCGECAIDTFGWNTRDMAGLTTPQDTADEAFVAELCEGCGAMVLVDHEGVRMTEIEPTIRTIDGKEESFWTPRDEKDVAAARVRLAAHSERPAPRPLDFTKGKLPD